jgi:hypothetical protein
MRQYMAKRRKNRKVQLIALLGGVCSRCNSTESLEFDHIIPGSQSFTICDCLDKPWSILIAEVMKCQLLCSPCHRQKSKECGETGGGHNKRTDPFIHGTARCYGYTRCRCEDCREAKRQYRNHLISSDEIFNKSNIKTRQSRKGRPVSQETKEKLRQAQLKRWQNNKTV